MPFRWRLILWFATIFLLVLIAMTTLSYAFHARGHYDDIDRALVLTAHHTVLEAALTQTNPPLEEGHAGFHVFLRIYDGQGQMLAHSDGMDTLPGIDPRTILAHPGGPAYDAIAGLAPPMVTIDRLADSTFTTLSLSPERWRVYVHPLMGQQGQTGYVEAFMPLGDVDASMDLFKLAMFGLMGVGVLVTMTGCWFVSGRALAPITSMIAVMDQMTESQDLAQRLVPPVVHDEIGQLATTFNRLLASLQQAAQTQQRFISDASHELRAPLTAILGNLELVRRHPERSATERDEALAEAEQEARRLNRLVTDLLALARADAGQLLPQQSVDLDSVVLDAFQSARALAHGQQMHLDPFVPVLVSGDRDRLLQLLVILVDNAIKYTPAAGTIRIGLARHDDHAVITVHDTGVGIAEADIPHIFERFYRADPARGRDPGGTGLGLAIAQWIVEQHGGHIVVSSTLGQGTTMSVILPALLITDEEGSEEELAGHGEEPYSISQSS